MSAFAWLWACAAPAPEGVDLAARFECARCHTAAEVLPTAPEERSCIDCHRAILRGEHDAAFDRDRVAGWKSHLHSLNDAPDLSAADRRMTRAWFVSQLLAPTDARPDLPATMPRLVLTPAEADVLADRFGVTDDDAGEPTGDPARGVALLATRCVGCHRLSGVGAGHPLAPDLALVARRSTPDQIDAFLADPSAVWPATRMPDPGLSPVERADVVAALFQPLPPPALPEVPAHPAAPEEPVTWETVDREVFHAGCRHCHADPAGAKGDGGPGNTGGFGYPGVGLDLSTWAGVRRGGRHDVLAPLPNGTPRLVAHLWARHDEVAGHPGPLLGMPLGLPPLSPEAIGRVEAWILSGAPGPTGE